MTTCRSACGASMPFRSASMTRRQASTVASSPRSLAASSTSQAISTGDRSSWLSPALRRRAEFMAVSPCLCQVGASVHGELSFTAEAGFDGIGVPACPIELEDVLRRLDVEPAELAFEIAQILGSDAMILGAEEQQPHGGGP